MGFLIVKERSAYQGQNGLAMVEFLISLPFLLMAFAAVVEFGIIFYTQTMLNSSVQDGTSYLSQNSVFGNFSFTELRPQFITNATNLIVYGNISGTGTPLISGLDTTKVSIQCVNGSVATLNGERCIEDATMNNLYPFYVSAQVAYTPVLGNLLQALTGVNATFTLKAKAISVGAS